MARGKTITKEEESIIVSLYEEGKNATEIGSIIGCERHTITRILKKRGIMIRCTQFKKKYTINEKYFDNIDTEEKAYFLGLLFADGNVGKNDNYVTMSLKIDDKEIIDKLLISMKSTYPTYFKPPKGDRGNGYGYEKAQAVFHICNKKINNRLKELGMIGKERLPELPSDLKRHFIRGVFDGDGCIHQSKRRKSDCEFYILAKEELCNDINQIFIDNGICEFKVKQRIKYIYKIRKSGRNNLNRIYKYLYEDATVFLERKYIIWEEIFDGWEELCSHTCA